MIDFPIKEAATIVHGNALQIEWETIVSRYDLNFLVGNPPWVGSTLMTEDQRFDMGTTFLGIESYGVLDYVTAWYMKAAQYILNTQIRCAFVSTNSISQGEQVSVLWKELFKKNIHIDFAYRTFRWSNDARGKAAVHCVIIGFSCVPASKERIIYKADSSREVSHNINPYLVNAKNILIESRSRPLCEAPQMAKGSIPVDDGNLIVEASDKEEFIRVEPNAEKYIRPFLGAREYINNQERWCLWLVGVSPKELHAMPLVKARIEAVRKFRLASKKAATRQFADRAMLFMEIRQPETEYILVPRHSSQIRKYIPIGFIPSSVIAGDANLIIPGASLYHFGILTSSMHMAWMRTTAGRIKSDYRYSANIVYNNFPWPAPTAQQRSEIERFAQAVLDARLLYPDCSLADLYDPTLMPIELTKAHQQLDRSVEKAYGKHFESEEECVAFLFERYAELAKTKN